MSLLATLQLMLKVYAQTRNNALNMKSLWNIENPLSPLQSADFNSIVSLGKKEKKRKEV